MRSASAGEEGFAVLSTQDNTRHVRALSVGPSLPGALGRYNLNQIKMLFLKLIFEILMSTANGNGMVPLGQISWTKLHTIYLYLDATQIGQGFYLHIKRKSVVNMRDVCLPEMQRNCTANRVKY